MKLALRKILNAHRITNRGIPMSFFTDTSFFTINSNFTDTPGAPTTFNPDWINARDTGGFGMKNLPIRGDAVTEVDGVFSFPKNGVWVADIEMVLGLNDQADAAVNAVFWAKVSDDNGSNYDTGRQTTTRLYQATSATDYKTTSISRLIEVDDYENVLFKFNFVAGNANMFINSGYDSILLSFVRLADI